MDWQEILKSILAALIASGVVGSFIFYYLKRRDEKKDRMFNLKYKEYQKYLRTLEEISEGSRSQFGKLFKETILGDNINLEKIFSHVISTIEKNTEAVIKAKNELHGLRLVGSDELLSLVDEFVQLILEIFDYSPMMIEDMKNEYLQSGKLPGEISDKDMQKKAERVQYLLKAITEQMRKELRS